MVQEIFQSAVLGIVQGLGEFLPISSTAHLILIPKFFHWNDSGLSFDVALHFGTLLAVVAYFWKDWVMIFKSAFQRESQKFSWSRSLRKSDIYGKNTLWFLLIATIPGVLAGYFLEMKAETIFRSEWLIALALAVAGLFLYIANIYLKHDKTIQKITLADSLLIGICQAVAIIPGISRSGATITAGLWRGLDRISAAKFSFILSMPIIFGATVLKFSYLLKNFDFIISVGIISSAISGYLAIKYLLKFVEKASYRIFFWYRMILAVIIFIFYLFK